jgi:hypothetical protein
MGQNVNLGIVPGDEFSVEPDRLTRHTPGGVLTHTILL